MNIKTTNLLEESVNFLDSTRKQNKHFKIFFKIVIIMFLFLFFSFFKKILPSNIRTIIRIQL